MAVGPRDTGLAVRKEEETKILQRWNLLGGDFRNPRMRRRAVRTAWTGASDDEPAHALRPIQRDSLRNLAVNRPPEEIGSVELK